MVDVALVVGVEKITDRVGGDLDAALATTGDSDFESVQGLTPTAQAAMLMQRYMHEYEVPANGLAGLRRDGARQRRRKPERDVSECHNSGDVRKGSRGQ